MPGEGYFSSWGAAGDPRLSGDPTRYPWGSAKQATANDGTGNEVSYIIERLCLNPNQASQRRRPALRELARGRRGRQERHLRPLPQVLR